MPDDYTIYNVLANYTLITLLKASLDKNYLLYIEELLEVIYGMKFKA